MRHKNSETNDWGWPHIISVAHGLVVCQKNKLFLWHTISGAPQK
jgi:hypothetical protein